MSNEWIETNKALVKEIVELRKAVRLAIEAMDNASPYGLTFREEIAALREALDTEDISPCNPHPKAPHGFDRNGSHNADCYVCDCESWDPYDAGYEQGRVDGYEQGFAEGDVRELYDSFEDWFQELEGYTLRSERFYEGLGQFQSDAGYRANLLLWLRAAFDAGRSSG